MVGKGRFGISEGGFSLVEGLVAAGVVAVVSTSLIYYSKMVSNPIKESSTNSFNCVSHGYSVLQKLQALAGPITSTSGSFVAFQGTRQIPELFSYPDIFPNSVLWDPAFPLAATDEDIPQIFLSSMYQGPIRVFNAFYNRNDIDFCSAFASAPEIVTISDQYAGAANIRIRNSIRSRLRVRRFDLASGTILPCNKPIFLRPKFSQSAAALNLIRHAPNVEDGSGLFVEVETIFTDPTEGARNCTVSDRLSYSIDERLPPAPVISLTGVGVPPSPAFNAHSSPGSVSIEVPVGDDQTALVCRDRSTVVPAGPYECYAGSSPGPGPQHSAGPIFDPYSVALGPPPPSETAASGFGASRPASWATPAWVPCERVTMCGQAPVNSSLTILDAPGKSYRITNNYNNLRSDCHVRIEAAAIDPSGNRNVSLVSPYNPAQVSISASGFATTIRPSCVNWCQRELYPPPDSTWYGDLNPYWQTGPCCRGSLGCQRGRVSNPGGALLPLSVDPPL